MISRCQNPNDAQFWKYGRRGINVCDRWLSFETFLADMGERPNKSFSLDRIDNDGDYEPGNCRWATRKEQARNRRSSMFIEYDGTRMTAIEWSERTGIPHDTLRKRIYAGWPVEDALCTPARHYSRRTILGGLDSATGASGVNS